VELMAKRTRRTRKAKPVTNEMHTAQLEQHLKRQGPAAGDPTAPTPERARAAKLADEQIIPILERTHTGNPTGRVTWRVEPTIVRLHRTNVLNDHEYAGAWRFMQLCEVYASKGNPKTAQLVLKVDMSGQPMGQQERAVESRYQITQASRSVHRFVRPMVLFLGGQCGDSASLADFMAAKYPHTASMGDRARRQEGQTYLKLCCGMLACYFGLSEHSYSHLVERSRIVAEEVINIQMRRQIEFLEEIS
jgi:hypothetical protein